MAEPIIYVIPPEYYGGALPKGRAKEMKRAEVSRAGIEPPRRFRLSSRAIFFIVIGALFVAVVAGASWYFTAPLRAPSPSAPAPLPEPQVPEPPALESAPEPPAPVEPQLPVAPAPQAAPSPAPPPDLSRDTDRDGLSDAEETVYRSEITTPDTDRDGFLDGHEVFHLYNPSGNAPERLLDAGLASEYVNDALGYSVFIPRTFSVAQNPDDPAQMRVQFGEVTVFTIAVAQRGEAVALAQWLRGQPDFAAVEVLPWTSNKAGLEAAVSGDSGIGWVARKDGAVLQVRFASDDAAARRMYKTTFEMMLNSVKIM